ncbi:MAG TPA: hypothetical protein VK517_09185 [Cyclobacteriaceae bacterium]|nr:hypothetical protein [Cyclobacteriaceae bacterium]
MKKLLVSALFYSVSHVFPFHRQEVIFSEAKSSKPLLSPALPTRTVRDYQGGLLDEGPFQCSALEHGSKKQNQDNRQRSGVYNFDQPLPGTFFSSSVPWMKDILKE